MSNPAVVPTSDPGSYGICIAFGQNAYSTSPTWTRIDDPLYDSLQNKATTPWNGRFVTAWSTDRGRTYELDKTQTGTASITVYDVTGYFDPTNRLGPLYGKITPMLPAKISVQNPANNFYYDIFTGFVESWDWVMDTAERMMTVTINLVDGFEPLTRGELEPASNGVTTFVGDVAATAAQTRISGILTLAGWPSGTNWRNINTGNIYLQPTVYNPQTSYLSAIQDVADAEFPGVSNFFMAKNGAATFYGRYPRFQPTNFPQDVNFWQAADKPGLAPAAGAALISDIQWALDSKNLINKALCYPYGIAETSISGQIVGDNGSIAQYGIRTFSIPDLISNGQPVGGGVSAQPALAANAATKIFSTYYVQNYCQPVLRISHLEFRTRLPGDSQTWALMTGVEIGDIITVFTSNPGGGGFSKETFGMGVVSQFFVEGIHNSISAPLQGNIPEWTMTLDVSPRAWFPNGYAIGG